MAARLLGLAAMALALAGCVQASQQASLTAATPLSSRAASAIASAAPSTARIRVYVTGAVSRPGVYELAPDSRIEDAISAAGGFVAGADMPRVNLAARVRDEQEIYVPKVGETATNLVANAVNLNSASASQLRDALSITSTLAGRIVAYRRQHGPFRSVDDLRQVPVPEDQLNRIRNLVVTG
ncbi:MAG TPA: ComEA family DNA-binding protein [Chloroflexota bacterium]